MKPKKLYFMDCHLAGRKYHDADEVMDQLEVGTVVELKRDRKNPYDPQAVKVIYRDALGEKYLLGYLPRENNSLIADFIDMGWKKIFECRISKIDLRAYYEQQIRLTVKILRKGNACKQGGSGSNPFVNELIDPCSCENDRRENKDETAEDRKC